MLGRCKRMCWRCMASQQSSEQRAAGQVQADVLALHGIGSGALFQTIITCQLALKAESHAGQVQADVLALHGIAAELRAARFGSGALFQTIITCQLALKAESHAGQVQADVLALHGIAAKLRAARFGSGALRLDNTKLNFTLDAEGNPDDAHPHGEPLSCGAIAVVLRKGSLSIATPGS